MAVDACAQRPSPRKAVLVADQLPDEITAPVSATCRCQNRARYRCESHVAQQVRQCPDRSANPGRRELLEALFDEETDAVCAAASTVQGEVACDRFLAWLPEFFSFFSNKRHIAAELLEHTDRTDPLVGDNRSHVLAAAAPLLDAAQRSGDIEPVLTIEQILDSVHAVAIQAPATYVEPILRAALDGSGPRACLPC